MAKMGGPPGGKGPGGPGGPKGPGPAGEKPGEQRGATQ